MELSGSLSGLGVRGLLQLLEHSRQTGRVHLRQGRWSGEIDVVGGRPVGAAVGHDSGSEALVLIARAFSNASFTFEARPPRTDTPTVPVQIDEAVLNEPAGSTPLLDRIPRMSETRPETGAVKVDRRVVGLLREVDGRRTVDGIAARVGLGPTLRGLDVLGELGLIEFAPPVSRPVLTRVPAAPPRGPRPSIERQSALLTGRRSPPARPVPPPPLAARLVRSRPAFWARVRPPVSAERNAAPVPAPANRTPPPTQRVTMPPATQPAVAPGLVSLPPEPVGRRRWRAAPRPTPIVVGLVAVGLTGLALAAGISTLTRPGSSAPVAGPIVEATPLPMGDAAPPVPEATAASVAAVEPATPASGALVAEAGAPFEATVSPASPTAVPRLASPTADAAWATLLTSLDAPWNSDWPTVVDRLSAFRRTYPDFAPTQDKLYVALVAFGQSRIAGGDLDGGRQLLEQARALLPDRPEAPAALDAASAPAPVASDQPAPAGDNLEPPVDDAAVGESDSSATSDASAASSPAPASDDSLPPDAVTADDDAPLAGAADEANDGSQSALALGPPVVAAPVRRSPPSAVAPETNSHGSAATRSAHVSTTSASAPAVSRVTTTRALATTAPISAQPASTKQVFVPPPPPATTTAKRAFVPPAPAP